MFVVCLFILSYVYSWLDQNFWALPSKFAKGARFFSNNVVYCRISGLVNDTFVFMVVGQCDLLERKGGKRTVHKFLQVTKCTSIYCSVGVTSRYH